MRWIIFNRKETGDQLQIFWPQRNGNEGELSDDHIEKRAWEAVAPYAINPQWIEQPDVPSDKTYRDAWYHDGGKIQTNMKKATAIHVRNTLSDNALTHSQLDDQFHKAIAAAKTPEELKAVVPAILIEKGKS